MPVPLNFAYCSEHKTIVRVANSRASDNDYPLVPMNMPNLERPHERFPATKGDIKTMTGKSWQPALLIDILTTPQQTCSMSYLLLMAFKYVQRMWMRKEDD